MINQNVYSKRRVVFLYYNTPPCLHMWTCRAQETYIVMCKEGCYAIPIFLIVLPICNHIREKCTKKKYIPHTKTTQIIMHFLAVSIYTTHLIRFHVMLFDILPFIIGLFDLIKYVVLIDWCTSFSIYIGILLSVLFMRICQHSVNASSSGTIMWFVG